jgi:flagellar basal-body rod protein FlgB
MLGAIFDSLSYRAAHAAITGLTRRQEAISANVANIDTPGYQRRSVDFETALQEHIDRELGKGTLATTNPKHFTEGGARARAANHVIPREVIADRNDGNAVSIDEEMALMAETQLLHQALTQTLGMRLGTLRSVIRGNR